MLQHACCLLFAFVLTAAAQVPQPQYPPRLTGPSGTEASTSITSIHQNEPARQRARELVTRRSSPSTTAKKKGGSLVRRAQESDRIAALASAETQVRARAVLPRSGSSEHQATS